MSYRLPNQRPRAPKSYLARWQADDWTLTRSVIRDEYCACDNYKVILLMCEQLMLIDRMQKEDVLAIVRRDLLRRRAPAGMPLYRPEAPQSWWDAWTSDDFYTQTETQVEYFAADCFKVIRAMCLQLKRYDRLSNAHILAVIEEDIDRHFVEEDVA